MATYNRGRHILPSIRSVLQQQYQDFELIIVGDCCTDETETVVRPYLSERVLWFNLSERCGSQSFPNNEGIARSTGRYIAYLGHDDIWTRDHLQSLARLFEEDAQLDFAIGGAIYHGPPGSDFRVVTGLFDDPKAPLEHFFPPSSLAHRRDVTDRIGPWAHAMEITAPVDADFLLRAAHAGMRFRSTQEITLHKFAAGHRYLSYLTHDSTEQEEALRKIESPDYRASVELEVDRARAVGFFMVAHHVQYEKLEKGALSKANAMGKGAIRPAPRPLTHREVIVQDNQPRALDWKDQQRPGDRIRWVDRNPRPKILLPYTSGERVRIEFTIAHAKADTLDRLKMSINGLPCIVRLSRPRQRDGVFEATGVVTVRLDRQDSSVAELHLTEAQRPHGEEAGIGMAEIVLTPTGLGALRSRVDDFAAKFRRHSAALAAKFRRLAASFTGR